MHDCVESRSWSVCVSQRCLTDHGGLISPCRENRKTFLVFDKSSFEFWMEHLVSARWFDSHRTTLAAI